MLKLWPSIAGLCNREAAGRGSRAKLPVDKTGKADDSCTVSPGYMKLLANLLD